MKDYGLCVLMSTVEYDVVIIPEEYIYVLKRSCSSKSNVLLDLFLFQQVLLIIVG